MVQIRLKFMIVILKKGKNTIKKAPTKFYYIFKAFKI